MPPPPGGYTPAGYGYAAQRTDGLAIASLIIGISSIVCSVACFGIILGPTAAIMGFIASVGWFFFVIVSGVFNSSSATPTP